MILTNDFKTTCTEGKPHVPEVDRVATTCSVCRKEITETSEYSGYWFTYEDYKNWDIQYNGVDETVD